MLEVQNLTKKYHDFTAVDHISFSLEKGKIYGFLGPNGAGKSTTLNMITGYLAPDEGSVFINQISLMKSPKKAKAFIGYLPEIPPLYLQMDVEEYLSFVCKLRGLKGRDIILAEINRVCGLTDIVDRKKSVIATLSKGYRQRVGIAAALVSDPLLIILDEPTVGLDPMQIVSIRKLLIKLKENHIVLLSTHILSEAESICDEFIIISEGKIVASADEETLMEQYRKKDRVKITLKENASRAERVLKELTSVQGVFVIRESTEETVLEVVGQNTVDLREVLIKACQEKNLHLLEIQAKDTSLEEIYLSLTKSRGREER